MNIWHRTRRALSARFRGLPARLARDRRGSVALFVAVTIIPLIGFVGLATDAARGYLVKSRLSYALDAAGLAGGRVMFSDTRDEDIVMYFNANFPPGYLGATVDGPYFQATDDGDVLTVEASATVPTTFMRLLGYETITVAAATEVTRETELLEVVLAIDMSGSMQAGIGGGQTRIGAARAAATELVNILFGADETKALLRIGLVPWNGKVNVTLNGTTYDSSATTTEIVPTFTHPVTGAAQSEVYYANNSPVPLLDPPEPDWRGCVYNRYSDDGFDGNDADVLYGPLSVGGADWLAWEPIVSAEGEPVPGGYWTGTSWNKQWVPYRCSSAPWGDCTPCLSHGITPLQNTKAAILDAINELTSPTGYTNIPAGLGWAWHVLMPEAPFTEGAADAVNRRTRAIVLLTDGANTGMWGDAYKAVFGVGGGDPPRSDMDARLRALADNIKAAGVTIYAIQFANSGGALEALMRDVASGPDAPFYQYAPDAEALQQVFREVANNLSELRLSR